MSGQGSCNLYIEEKRELNILQDTGEKEGGREITNVHTKEP